MNRPSIRICRALYPLACLYGAGVWLRNLLFDRGWLPSRSFPLPVISVGNLTVGGTGKTPHTEYLIRLLHPRWQTAVLSRGYRRRTSGFVLGTSRTTAADIGDEPCQMLRKFPGLRVAVDADRCHGIARLTDGQTAPGTEVILLDDAFQHRYVRPGLSLLLIDYHRPVTADTLLPAGRLREPVAGKRRADLLIVSKCPPDMGAAERREWERRLACLPRQRLFFTTLTYGALYPLGGGAARPLHSLGAADAVLLLTGIASPAALLQELARHTRHVTPLTFADHHAFTAADLRRLEQAFGQLPHGRRLIITTEKDATRLADCPHLPAPLRAALYVLPVEVSFLFGEAGTFNQTITEYVQQHLRNSRLPEGTPARPS